MPKMSTLCITGKVEWTVCTWENEKSKSGIFADMGHRQTMCGDPLFVPQMIPARLSVAMESELFKKSVNSWIANLRQRI